MTNEEKEQATEYTIKLITKLLQMNFIDMDGDWTRLGRDHTSRCINSRFFQFTHSKWDNMEDPESLRFHLLDGDCIWLCDTEDEWSWCSINEPGNTLERWIDLVNITSDKLQISLKPELETFDDDDMLDI